MVKQIYDCLEVVKIEVFMTYVNRDEVKILQNMEALFKKLCYLRSYRRFKKYIAR